MRTLLAVVCDEGRKVFPRGAREISTALWAQQQKGAFKLEPEKKVEFKAKKADLSSNLILPGQH